MIFGAHHSVSIRIFFQNVMTDHENTVLAATLAGLMLVLVYLCPWRVEETGEIQWSPIYQKPLTSVRTFDPDYGTKGGTRVEKEDAEIAYGILALELIAVAAAGEVMYRITKSDTEGDSQSSE
jgi:hypothetical protein